MTSKLVEGRDFPAVLKNGKDHYQAKYSRNKPKPSRHTPYTLPKSEPQPSSSSKVEPKCLLCSFEAPTIQKLKTHLLLKHPKSNFCLFCVGKKGWSDDFASPSQYDEHYKYDKTNINLTFNPKELLI